MRRLFFIALLTFIPLLANATHYCVVEYLPVRTTTKEMLGISFQACLRHKQLSLFVRLKGEGHGGYWAKFYDADGNCILIKFNSTHRNVRKHEYEAVAGVTSKDLQFLQSGKIVRILIYDKVFDCDEKSNEDLINAVKQTNFATD